jgi:hypothetical protein
VSRNTRRKLPRRISLIKFEVWETWENSPQEFVVARSNYWKNRSRYLLDYAAALFRLRRKGGYRDTLLLLTCQLVERANAEADKKSSTLEAAEYLHVIGTCLAWISRQPDMSKKRKPAIIEAANKIVARGLSITVKTGSHIHPLFKLLEAELAFGSGKITKEGLEALESAKIMALEITDGRKRSWVYGAIARIESKYLHRHTSSLSWRVPAVLRLRTVDPFGK